MKKFLLHAAFVLATVNSIAVDAHNFASSIECASSDGKVLKIGISPLENRAYVYVQKDEASKPIETKFGDDDSRTNVAIESESSEDLSGDRDLAINVSTMNLSTYVTGGFYAKIKMSSSNNIRNLEFVYMLPVDDEGIFNLDFTSSQCTYTEGQGQ